MNTKTKNIFYWVILYIATFVFLQITSKYHYFYLSQNHIFISGWEEFWKSFTYWGGLSKWFANFIIQFWTYPYFGALTFALIYTLCTACTKIICQKIKESTYLVIWVLPAIGLFCGQFDTLFQWQGMLSFTLMMLALAWYVSIKSKYRKIAGFVLFAILFWWTGAVSALFVLAVILFELFNHNYLWRYLLLLSLFGFILPFVGVYTSWIGTMRVAFLPEAYYFSRITPMATLYYSWIALIATLLLIKIVPSFQFKKEWLNFTIIGLQIIVLVFGTNYCLDKNKNIINYRIEIYDYFAATKQWDKITSVSKGRTQYTNIELNYLNLALNEKGVLADSIFFYRQISGESLISITNSEYIYTYPLQSDLFFTMGNPAGAQRWAFASYLYKPNPRSLKRLIETNLVYGAYPVAEKYISILEKTWIDRRWAQEHRKFLYNDNAIENDPILGNLRRCLLKDNHLAVMNGLNLEDLETIANTNPAKKSAIEYLGTFYLLCRMDSEFKTMIDKYYGTEVLPTLPQSFKEALVLFYQNNKEYCLKYGIDESSFNKLSEFQKATLQLNDQNKVNQMISTFGNTFWFYTTFLYQQQ